MTGTRKRGIVFKIPVATAAGTTSKINGNITCVIVTVKAALSGGNRLLPQIRQFVWKAKLDNGYNA